MRDASEWAVVLVNDVFSETGDKPVTREVMEREDRAAYRALVDTVSRIQSAARADVLALRSRVRELEGRLAEVAVMFRDVVHPPQSYDPAMHLTATVTITPSERRKMAALLAALPSHRIRRAGEGEG